MEPDKPAGSALRRTRDTRTSAVSRLPSGVDRRSTPADVHAGLPLPLPVDGLGVADSAPVAEGVAAAEGPGCSTYSGAVSGVQGVATDPPPHVMVTFATPSHRGKLGLSVGPSTYRNASCTVTAWGPGVPTIQLGGTCIAAVVGARHTVDSPRTLNKDAAGPSKNTRPAVESSNCGVASVPLATNTGTTSPTHRGNAKARVAFVFTSTGATPAVRAANWPVAGDALALRVAVEEMEDVGATLTLVEGLADAVGVGVGVAMADTVPDPLADPVAEELRVGEPDRVPVADSAAKEAVADALPVPVALPDCDGDGDDVAVGDTPTDTEADAVMLLDPDALPVAVPLLEEDAEGVRVAVELPDSVPLGDGVVVAVVELDAPVVTLVVAVPEDDGECVSLLLPLLVCVDDEVAVADAVWVPDALPL